MEGEFEVNVNFDIIKGRENQDRCINLKTPSIIVSGILDGNGIRGDDVVTRCREFLKNHLSKLTVINANSLTNLISMCDEYVCKFPEAKRSGTTLSMAVHSRTDATTYVCNVGDSKTVVFNDDAILFESIEHKQTKSRLELTNFKIKYFDKKSVLICDELSNAILYGCGVTLVPTSILGHSLIKLKNDILQIDVTRLSRKMFDSKVSIISASDGFWDVILTQNPSDWDFIVRHRRSASELASYARTLWEEPWKVLTRSGLEYPGKHKIPESEYDDISVSLMLPN